MKFQCGSMLLAGSLLFPIAQLAAQEQAVLGQGNVSCGSWLNNGKGDDAQASNRTAWVLGYVTAFNQYGSKPEGDVSGGKDTEVLMVRIDDHCRLHPLDNLYNASDALVDELRQ